MRHVSAFRRAARRQSDRGPRPGSDPDADEMNRLAASGALCWAAGMAASKGRVDREPGVGAADGSVGCCGLLRYKHKHDHTLRDDNLKFTQLSDKTRDLVMDLVHIGVDTKEVVSYVPHCPSC